MRDAQTRVSVLIKRNIAQAPVINAKTEAHRLLALERVDDEALRPLRRSTRRHSKGTDQVAGDALNIPPRRVGGDLAVDLAHVEHRRRALLDHHVGRVPRWLIVELELAAPATGGNALEFDESVGQTACRPVLARDQHLVLDWVAWLRGLRVHVPQRRQVLVDALPLVQVGSGEGQSAGSGEEGKGVGELHFYGCSEG